MEEKKQIILENVGKLYLKHGIKSITMDDVAQEFGISKKTLYQFFKDKESLVEEVINYYMENPHFNLNDENNGNPIDRIFALRIHLASILRVYNNNLEFDLKKQYPALYKKLHDFKRKKILNDNILNIEDGKKQGLFRKDIDTEFISKLNVGRMLLTMNPDHNIFDESELASIEIFDKTIDYHLHGICTEKGLKYYKEQLNSLQNEKQN
ncbi:MAG: TetR/AcrR family transcriptional regulator [Mariniphaga sp.]|nr:TetR/AcrR family transcriptional regulator [Mariniphaga sp.]